MTGSPERRWSASVSLGRLPPFLSFVSSLWLRSAQCSTQCKQAAAPQQCTQHEAQRCTPSDEQRSGAWHEQPAAAALSRNRSSHCTRRSCRPRLRLSHSTDRTRRCTPSERDSPLCHTRHSPRHRRDMRPSPSLPRPSRRLPRRSLPRIPPSPLLPPLLSHLPHHAPLRTSRHGAERCMHSRRRTRRQKQTLRRPPPRSSNSNNRSSNSSNSLDRAVRSSARKNQTSNLRATPSASS